MLQQETQMPINPPEILTARQVAKRGILPERTLRRLIAQNKIPVIRSGRTAYINFTALLRELDAGTGRIFEGGDVD